MKQEIQTSYQDTVGQIAAIKANDEKVLNTLYQNNYYKVEKYVLDNNGSIDQAKDIFQEAFIALWRNIQLDKFQPESETAISGYLYQIAKNKWIDYLRSGYHKKTAIMDTDALKEQLYEDVTQEETNYLAAVSKHFNSLGEQCKDVLSRFYYRKQSLRTIATALNWTEATARNNKYRCLQKLRALVAP